MVAQPQEVRGDKIIPSDVKTSKESYVPPISQSFTPVFETPDIDGSRTTIPPDNGPATGSFLAPSGTDTADDGNPRGTSLVPTFNTIGSIQVTATTKSQPTSFQTTAQDDVPSGAARHSLSSTGSSGFSTGSFVGAIVGCAIGAALLASLITFLCTRRHNQKQNREGPRKLPSDLSEKPYGDPNYFAPPPAKAAAVATEVSQPTWLNHLPYPEEDAAVAHEVAAMLDLVSQHVNYYYQDAYVELTPDLNGKLEAVDSNHLPESIISMLPATRHPRALIKHCIANEIISRISPTGGNAETFLPEDYVQLPHAISNATNGWRRPVSFDSAFAQWRVLTAYLRPPPTSDPMHLDRIDAIIKDTSFRLSNTFASWAVPKHSLNERQEKLAALMRKGAETGIMIFAQPSTFAFQWASSEVPVGAVEVTPALVKSMDEQGRWLGRSLMLVQARVENV